MTESIYVPLWAVIAAELLAAVLCLGSTKASDRSVRHLLI
jgi:hypothetical protein